jgi:hypothetical protein
MVGVEGIKEVQDLPKTKIYVESGYTEPEMLFLNQTLMKNVKKSENLGRG